VGFQRGDIFEIVAILNKKKSSKINVSVSERHRWAFGDLSCTEGSEDILYSLKIASNHIQGVFDANLCQILHSLEHHLVRSLGQK